MCIKEKKGENIINYFWTHGIRDKNHRKISRILEQKKHLQE